MRLDVLHVEHLNSFSLSLVGVLEHTLIISLFLSSLLLLDSFQTTSSWLDFVAHCLIQSHGAPLCFKASS